MDRFQDVLKKESSLGYVYRLAKESERMLQATKKVDTRILAVGIAYDKISKKHACKVEVLS